MDMILLSIGDKPAAQGIGDVLMWLLMVVGVLALIYAVLAVMDRVYKKKGGSDMRDDSADKPGAKTFPHMLSEELKKNAERNAQDNNDGSGHI